MTEEKEKYSFDLHKEFLEEVKNNISVTKEDWLNDNFKKDLSKNAAVKLNSFLCQLNDLKEDIQRIETFLKRFPNPKFYEKNSINRLQYIKYHTEVYFHKIYTILEIKKLILNDLFEIGLKEKDCTWQKLKKDASIKNSQFEKIIEAYYKTFKNVISARHSNTHRAIYNDPKSEELSNFENLYRNFKKYNEDIGDDFRKLKPEPVLEYQIKKLQKERAEYIKESNLVVADYIDDFKILVLHYYLKILKVNAT